MAEKSLIFEETLLQTGPPGDLSSNSLSWMNPHKIDNVSGKVNDK